MSDKRVKVYNRTKGGHTFVFSDGIRRIRIPAGGFQLIPIEEVYYVNATSKSFKKGILEIDPNEEELIRELGYEIRNVNSYTVEEFKNLLKGNFTKGVKDKLQQVTEKFAKDKLLTACRQMDLPKTKVKFIEEVTGVDVYIDELLGNNIS